MKLRLLPVLLLLVCLTLLLSACSAKSGEIPSAAGASASPNAAGNPSVPREPVKLYFYVNGPTLTDTEFNLLIAGPINKKYPHITLERIQPKAGVTIEDVFTTTTPDLSLIINPHPLIRLNAAEDLRPYIQKYGFDESRLKPILYDHIKEFSKNGEIVAIPFNSNQAVLYYNKDIFDKFGIEYPPAGKQLSYEQLLELGRKLTRTVGGTNYIGFEPNGASDLMRLLQLPLLEPDTGKSLLLERPEWTKIYEFLQKVYETPGFIGANRVYNHGRDAFMKDQRVALRVANLANMVGPLEELRQGGVEFNWDIAPSPNFADQLPKAREAQVHSFVITKTSKHKEEAFLGIKEILTDEVQLLLSRNARVPAVLNPDLEKQFGAEIPVLKGKRIEDTFVGQQLKNHRIHEYEDKVTSILTEASDDIALNGADVRSALRKASEKVDKAVETLKNLN
ncbi:ABC transporter substrate-binding protein [Paenibacillus hemerocallicola]|uniref:ABC transporter substrate-binding protein n=1 Tax=Paenibacillus hemerocallicola TaxID=1172614 RepID=UPI001FE8C825|nr:extracellular solute-binding protein [Paenibacillus hemerocallicola]